VRFLHCARIRKAKHTSQTARPTTFSDCAFGPIAHVEDLAGQNGSQPFGIVEQRPFFLGMLVRPRYLSPKASGIERPCSSRRSSVTNLQPGL